MIYNMWNQDIANSFSFLSVGAKVYLWGVVASSVIYFFVAHFKYCSGFLDFFGALISSSMFWVVSHMANKMFDRYSNVFTLSWGLSQIASEVQLVRTINELSVASLGTACWYWWGGELSYYWKVLPVTSVACIVLFFAALYIVGREQIGKCREIVTDHIAKIKAYSLNAKQREEFVDKAEAFRVRLNMRFCRDRVMRWIEDGRGRFCGVSGGRPSMAYIVYSSNFYAKGRENEIVIRLWHDGTAELEIGDEKAQTFGEWRGVIDCLESRAKVADPRR